MKRYLLVDTNKGDYGPSNPITEDNLVYIGDTSTKPVDSITSDDIEQWFEAYNWGNHTEAGYAQQSDVDAIVQDKYYLHEQGLPSSTWIINHNLNKRPSISCFDSNGKPVWGEVEHIDVNTSHVYFNGGFSGTADAN
jgi:hypothetical protein